MLISGSSIIACRGTGCHILASDEDGDIFKAILKLLKKSTLVVVTTQLPLLVEDSQDIDSITIVACKFS